MSFAFDIPYDAFLTSGEVLTFRCGRDYSVSYHDAFKGKWVRAPDWLFTTCEHALAQRLLKHLELDRVVIDVSRASGG